MVLAVTSWPLSQKRNIGNYWSVLILLLVERFFFCALLLLFVKYPVGAVPKSSKLQTQPKLE